MAIVPRIVRLLGMEGDRKRDKSLSGVMIIDVGRMLMWIKAAGTIRNKRGRKSSITSELARTGDRDWGEHVTSARGTSDIPLVTVFSLTGRCSSVIIGYTSASTRLEEPNDRPIDEKRTAVGPHYPACVVRGRIGDGGRRAGRSARHSWRHRDACRHWRSVRRHFRLLRA